MLAIDKPPGWMLIPHSWDRTNRNLQLALRSSINAGDLWARSRSLKFLRFVHRLDAETSGVLLFAKSRGALRTFSELFAHQKMEKVYLAVVRGIPSRTRWEWIQSWLDPKSIGRMKIDLQNGNQQELVSSPQTRENTALVEARPERDERIKSEASRAAGHPVEIRSTPSRDHRTGGYNRAWSARHFPEYVDPFPRRRFASSPDADSKKVWL